MQTSDYIAFLALIVSIFAVCVALYTFFKQRKFNQRDELKKILDESFGVIREFWNDKLIATQNEYYVLENNFTTDEIKFKAQVANCEFNNSIKKKIDVLSTDFYNLIYYEGDYISRFNDEIFVIKRNQDIQEKYSQLAKLIR